MGHAGCQEMTCCPRIDVLAANKGTKSRGWTRATSAATGSKAPGAYLPSHEQDLKRARKISSLGAGVINDRKPCSQTSKQSAGKNIPSNVITTTFVTYLIYMYLNTYTLLDDKKRIERSRRGSSPALPLFTFNEPVVTKAGSTTSRAR